MASLLEETLGRVLGLVLSITMRKNLTIFLGLRHLTPVVYILVRKPPPTPPKIFFFLLPPPLLSAILLIFYLYTFSFSFIFPLCSFIFHLYPFPSCCSCFPYLFPVKHRQCPQGGVGVALVSNKSKNIYDSHPKDLWELTVEEIPPFPCWPSIDQSDNFPVSMLFKETVQRDWLGWKWYHSKDLF